MSACEKSPRLDAYHDGELPQGACREMEAHLAACAACAAELQEIRALSQALRSAPLPDLSQDARQRLNHAVLPLPQRGMVMTVRALMAIAAVIFLIAAASLLVQVKQAARGSAPSGGTPVGLNSTENGHGAMHFARWILDELRGK